MVKNILKHIPQKAMLWFLIFLTGIALFAVYRFVFILSHNDYWTVNEFSRILYTFWIGFRFDTLAICWFLLPLFLLALLPLVKFDRKTDRITAITIFTALYSIFSFINAADIGFFNNFGSRMNYWALEYIGHPGMFFYSLVNYPSFWILILLWLVISFVFYLIIRKVVGYAAGINIKISILQRIIIYVMMILLMVFGIRGRLGMKALEWGTAYFCENQFLNQASLNPVYTLLYSIYEESDSGLGFLDQSIQRFQFHDAEIAYQTVADMLEIPQENRTEDFNISRKISSNKIPEFSPNIIIVILESWAAEMIGSLGADYDISPEFDSLASGGILFDNFYANGIRTNRGIPAVLGSFPSPPGRPVMKRFSADYPFRSLAQYLDDADYQSIFAHGGDIEFDNIRGFLKSLGYDKFYAENDFDTDERLGKWGIPDHIFFEKVVERIDSFRRPFNLTMMSLSFHDPYLIPDSSFRKYNDDYNYSYPAKLNCFYYTDQALGKFIDELKKLPVFDSTIFIFTADHCPSQESKFALDPKNFRIPLLIYAPALLEYKPSVISKTGSQVDIIPTILGLLDINTEYIGWGRDLMNIDDNDTGFAVLIQNERFGLIEGTDFYVQWIGGESMLYKLLDNKLVDENLKDSYPELVRRMKKKLTSYIQMAYYLSRGDKR